MRERLAPSARSDRYGNRINRERSPWREVSVPYISILIASLVPFVFLGDLFPILPPLGFLMFLGWRLMRQGLFPFWIGVPLGAFDDLFSGQPFGSGVLLWSITMIVMELVETRFPWRGFWQDWFTAGLGAALYILIAGFVSGAQITFETVFAALPQIVLAIMLYPFLARIIAGFDRFRLSRSRRIT